LLLCEGVFDFVIVTTSVTIKSHCNKQTRSRFNFYASSCVALALCRGDEHR